MFDVYLRAYKDTRLAKQLTKQIIDNMLNRLQIGGRAFAERYVQNVLQLSKLLSVKRFYHSKFFCVVCSDK